MVRVIRNPKTGRMIHVDGAVYIRLQKEGVVFDARTVEERQDYIPPADDSYKVTKRFSKKFAVDHSATPWGEVKPSKPSDRRKVLAECGASCFLVPETLKFPICNKDVSEGCTYNCRGIKAASSRAGQWKYKKVLDRSKQLSTRFSCYKK